MSLILFYILAGVILISALMVVTLRNIFHSALSLVFTFFFVAGIYLMLDAEFLAAIQVLIYVGAVTILILFAIMLTHKIQSHSARQVNENVIPAAIICVLFLAMAGFTMIKTFDVPSAPSSGAWTASLDLSDLPADHQRWNWTINIEDRQGQSYVAGGYFALYSDRRRPAKVRPVKLKNNKNGYILSASSDYSTVEKIFSADQTAYMKVWTDGVDINSIAKAEWTLTAKTDFEVTIELSNNAIEKIGRLLMSDFVLPFEVVSILLLAALIGAIVIARKDE
ncbi:MAG: NADH-quinone oxidoreductase subunit J [candidate division Zixibacteria bacterium]